MAGVRLNFAQRQKFAPAMWPFVKFFWPLVIIRLHRNIS